MTRLSFYQGLAWLSSLVLDFVSSQPNHRHPFQCSNIVRLPGEANFARSDVVGYSINRTKIRNAMEVSLNKHKKGFALNPPINWLSISDQAH